MDDDLRDGCEAYAIGLPRTACPFDPDNDDEIEAERAHSWLEGWDYAKAEAQRLIEGRGELAAIYD